MALYFLGDDDFEQSGPPQWRRSLWELDQLIIPWRGGITKLDAFLAQNPTDGTVPSPIDDNMLLMQAVPDNHKQFPTVELIYSGRKGGILPPQKHDTEDTVGSASSSRSSTTVLNIPTVAQFYAPTNILSYISTDGPGTQIAADPLGDPRIIQLTINDTAYTPTTFTVPYIMQNFFQIQTITSFKSTELVPGRYWQNVSRKIKNYTAVIFDIPHGAAYALLSFGGQGYQLNDVLTINGGGGSGTVTVFGVYTGLVPEGQIAAVTQGTNSFTQNANDVPSIGGRGHGARFNILVIP